LLLTHSLLPAQFCPLASFAVQTAGLAPVSHQLPDAQSVSVAHVALHDA
jgi:hypothetical protein